MPLLNIGFLAHVDAGKTSLTERILFETGVLATPGEVDSGTTHTDTLELEQQRGITIQSAVVSFTLGNLKVNIIDTPGHADFIAEVDRALSALDAVVIVISAVEGVQPQTRKLVRAVQELGLPFVLFCNKIDRAGARYRDLLEDIEQKLNLQTVVISEPVAMGTPDAAVQELPLNRADVWDALGSVCDDFLRTWVTQQGELRERVTRNALRRVIRSQALVPVWFGSAISGAGVRLLISGIRSLVPRADEPVMDPVSGVIFKIQRAPSGEKLVYVRMRTGIVRHRQMVTGPEWSNRVTAIDQFNQGRVESGLLVQAGDIARLHGLRDARIGESIGLDAPVARPFSPPTLESVVKPVCDSQVVALYSALQHLADQDPLIDVRRDDRTRDLSVRLYGEVQKEVLAATLASEFGIAVEFQDSSVVCIERVVGAGEALEWFGPGNPFEAGVHLQLQSAPIGSGLVFSRPSGALPLAFYVAIEETVRRTLQEGLLGWEVPDVEVTVVNTQYSSPTSTAGDFRGLVPLLVMAALQQAGTRVCEPLLRFEITTPVESAGAVLPLLVANRAVPERTENGLQECNIYGTIPAATLRTVEQRLPGVTNGLGSITTEFAGYEPVTGVQPVRPRTDLNPLIRAEYLARLARAL